MANREIGFSHKTADCAHEREIIGVCFYELDAAGHRVSNTLWYQTKQQAHDDLKAGSTYWSVGKDGSVASVYSAGSGSGRYIETKRDRSKADNLLNLDGCSPERS